jgi:hypothetical protein
MHRYAGICSCGAVTIELLLPQDISIYAPRKCDCDYCIQRGIEYLSDPQGQITFISKHPLHHEKQGSKQASFLLCANCKNVLGVSYIANDIFVGSVNARLLEPFESLQGSVVVSPKRLSNVEKVGRWSDFWSQVRIVIG